jgi:putative endopeptidase
MLTLAGDAHAAVDRASHRGALKPNWPSAVDQGRELRDPVKAYNKVELAKLAKLAPGYDWNAYLKDAGVAGKVSYVIVSQPSYLKGFDRAARKHPLDTWKAYFQWQLVAPTRLTCRSLSSTRASPSAAPC